MRAVVIISGLILLLGLAQGGWCDDRYEDDLQLWTPVTLELPLSEKVSGTLQLEARVLKNASDPTLRNITPALTYAVNEHLDLTAAYGWYFNADYECEERLYQQVMLKKNWSGIQASLRGRLEERFIEGTNGASLRNRYMVQFKVPIGKTRSYLVTSNEAHINLNSQKNGPQRGFNQNRLYIGIGREIGKKLVVEGGYQVRVNHLIDKTDTMEHIILTRVNYRIR